MRARRIVTAFASVLALAGCGIPVDTAARPLSPDEVPLPPTAPAPAPTPLPGDSTQVPLDVFFVRDSRLAPVRRQLSAAPSVEDAIAAVLTEPTSSERSRGLRTALTRRVRLAGAVAAGIPLIDVSETFAGTEGEEQILALAQLVFTLTGLPGVEGVSFALEGRPVEVPTGDGTLKGGPLRREDFSAVAPVG